MGNKGSRRLKALQRIAGGCRRVNTGGMSGCQGQGGNSRPPHLMLDNADLNPLALVAGNLLTHLSHTRAGYHMQEAARIQNDMEQPHGGLPMPLQAGRKPLSEMHRIKICRTLTGRYHRTPCRLWLYELGSLHGTHFYTGLALKTQLAINMGTVLHKSDRCSGAQVDTSAAAYTEFSINSNHDTFLSLMKHSKIRSPPVTSSF